MNRSKALISLITLNVKVTFKFDVTLQMRVAWLSTGTFRHVLPCKRCTRNASF